MTFNKKPSFVLIDPLPVDILAHNFLGRIVADIEHPTHEYCPEDPGSVLTHSPLKTVDLIPTSIVAAAATTTDPGNSKIRGALDFLTSGRWPHDRKPVIITRCLPQHRECFESIVKAHKKNIVTLLSKNQGKGYLTVACKSHMKVNTDATDATEAGNERIFAVQYRRVKLKRFRPFSAAAEVTYGDLSHVDFGDGIYGDVNSEDETLFEDDDSDDYFDQDDLLEVSNLITSHDRGFKDVVFVNFD